MEKEFQDVGTDRDKSHRGRDQKRDGEAAEAVFLSKATGFGFEVAKPWGDSSRFDFILHTGSRCWRAQVKSTCSHEQFRWRVTLSNGPYLKEDIDFLAAYIVPYNAWYILPADVFCNRSAFWFSPQRWSTSQFELYREAWCLMACPRDGRCSPEIRVWRRCLATDEGECPFHRCDPPTKLGP